MKSHMNKLFVNLFLQNLFATLLISIVVWFFQKNYIFEDGLYAKYAIQFINYQNLNVLELVKDVWFQSSSGYFPSIIRIGFIALIVPIYLIKYLFATVFNMPVQTEWDFLNTHIIYVSFGLVFFYQLMKKFFSSLTIKNFHWAFFGIFLGTNIFWFSIFESTTPEIIGAFYTAAILYYIAQTERNKNPYQLFFEGFLAGYCFSYRIQLLWVMIYFLMTTFKKRTSKLNVFAFLTGLLSSIALFLLIKEVQNPGESFSTHGVYVRTSAFWYFAPRSFITSLIGPNGYFTTQPLYLCVFFALIYFVSKKRMGEESLSVTIAILFHFLLLSYHFTWPVFDGFIGRHNIIYAPIYMVAFGFLLEELSKTQKAFRLFIVSTVIFIVYHLLITQVYNYVELFNEYWKWPIFYYAFSKDTYANLSKLIPFYVDNKSFSSFKFLLFDFFTVGLVLNLVLFFAKKIFKDFRRLFYFFNAIIFLTWFLIATVNYKNSQYVIPQKNLITFKPGSSCQFYDDLFDLEKRSSLFYLYRDNCYAAVELKKIWSDFIKGCLPYIKDNSSFKSDLLLGKYRPSLLEAPTLDSEYQFKIAKCSQIK